MTSVNTNYGALVALQNLTATTRELNEVQTRINTGLKVASARDNGAVFAIAEGQRVRSSSLAAIRDGLDRATTTIDTALAAGAAIGDILKQLKEKAVAAQAQDLSQAQRDALQADYAALRAQINQIADSATFNGANLINGTNLTGGPNELQVLATDGGSAGAGQFKAQGAALAGTQTTASLVEGAGANDLQVAADTQVTFRFNSGETIVVETNAGETLGQFLARVGQVTNGRVSGAIESGRITYTSSEQFQITVAGTGNTAAENNILGAGRTAQRPVSSGFQLTTAALAAGTNEATVLDGVVSADIANGDQVVFRNSSGDSIGAVTWVDTDSIRTFMEKVASATEGRVQLRLNPDNTLTYTSSESFFISFQEAAGGNITEDEARTIIGDRENAAGTSTAASAVGAEFHSRRAFAVASTASSSVALAGLDFRLGTAGQALEGLTAAMNISTASDAITVSSALDLAITNINRDLARLGSQGKALGIQRDFLSKLSDEVQKGIGSLVDADLARESARLQALQIKQQLGAQALSIANQAPQVILRLFQ
jgi:flagellin